MIDETKIKLCPFCGHSAILGDTEINEDNWFYGFLYNVFCPNCGATTDNFFDDNEAINKWNNGEIKE